MDWMKILSKGCKYVVQIIVIVGIIWLFIECNNGSRELSDLSTKEDIKYIRKELGVIQDKTLTTIGIVEGLVENGVRVTDGLETLQLENRRARDITSEIGKHNEDHISRVRNIQDRSIESELVTDGILQLIRTIERENDYN